MENLSELNFKKVLIFGIIFGIVKEVIPDLFIQNPQTKLLYKIVLLAILFVIIVIFSVKIYRVKGYNFKESIPYIILIALSFGLYFWLNLRDDF